MKFKTLLVERNIDCPNCGKDLSKGDVMLEDEYRGDKLCGYCKEDYKDAVIAEEGESGRLLK
jgi:ssDNA-binding Zn-finger/Zn-ribbon topoisomerase 1